MERMNILEAERVAQDLATHAGYHGWNKKFEIHTATNIIMCEWLDPFFGFFCIDGQDGFLRTADLPRGTMVMHPTE